MVIPKFRKKNTFKKVIMKQLFVIGCFLLVVTPGSSAEEAPIIDVIYTSTAHTIPMGTLEMQVAFPLLSLWMPDFYLAYGLTEGTQVRTYLDSDLLGYLNVEMRFSLDKLTSFPFAVEFFSSYKVANSTLWNVVAGLVLSTDTESISVNTQIMFSIMTAGKTNLYTSGRVGIVYPLARGFAIIGEAEIPVIRIRAGVLVRIAPDLDLRAWLVIPNFDLVLGVTNRF